MSRKTAFPFQIIPDALVDFGGWMIGDPGAPLHPAPDVLEDWDYERDLEVSVALEVGLDEVGEVLQIPPDALALDVLLKTGTGTGNMPRRIDLLSVKRIGSGVNRLRLSGVIPSAELSGRLRLDCGIVLGSEPQDPGPLSPRWCGSRLWQIRKDILIEDSGDSRFPIELTSFGRVFEGLPQMHAPWFVDWRPETFHTDFAGGVRVYVNSDIPEIATRTVDGDPLTLQAILADAMSQMVGSALRLEDCDEQLADCGEGSVGDQLSKWMELAFPGQPTGAVRAMMQHLPSRFNAALLAAAEIGDDT